MIHTRDLGNGAEQALALHCGLGNSAMWKGVAAALEGMSLLAPDLPGHGKSAPFPEGVDVHDAATVALRGLLDRPRHVIGHSFGATVALRLALEAPEKILSLTLIEPVFFAAAAESALKQAHRAAEEAVFEFYADGDMMATAQGFNALWGGGAPWESFPAPAQAGMAALMPFVIGTEPSLWQDCHDMLRPGGLEALSAPVTLIRGGQSVPIVTEIHKGLMARLPDVREVVIEGAGHMLVMSHAAEVAQAVMAGAELQTA
jgi:pimeloyl-ACP methyl ester carboxylesterase